MAAFQRALAEIDARPLLPLIQAPTLILQRRNSAFVPYSHGQYLADHIAGAKLVELPGTEQSIVWETPQLALGHIEEFLTGARHGQDSARVLATVLFTDIVGSTQQARRLGDRHWRELLDVHDELAGRLVSQAGGRLAKTTGDGFLATFDGPGRGIHCAIALRDQLRGIAVQIRAGLHAGEVELRDGDVGGMALHIAARVMAATQPEEILVSRTVRDLVVGSDLVLDDRGTRPLKSVEGDWQLFAVHRRGNAAQAEGIQLTATIRVRPRHTREKESGSGMVMPLPCCLSFPTARSFRQSFHTALLGHTGAHWLDGPSDLSSQENTRQHAVDDPRLSCKQQVAGGVQINPADVAASCWKRGHSLAIPPAGTRQVRNAVRTSPAACHRPRRL